MPVPFWLTIPFSCSLGPFSFWLPFPFPLRPLLLPTRLFGARSLLLPAHLLGPFPLPLPLGQFLLPLAFSALPFPQLLFLAFAL